MKSNLIKLSMTLGLLLVLLIIPQLVEGASSEDLLYSISGGEVRITGCNSLATGYLTIPDEIKGYPVTSIGNNAFQYRSAITGVRIPDTVTTIGDSAFWCCTGIKNLNLPDNLTSIGEGAFYDCSALTSIDIPNTVTSIGDSAFYGCDELKSIKLPNSITSIGNSVFSSCTSLNRVTIPDGVISIGEWAFNGCTSLTDITIPNSVTSIGKHAFYECKALKSIDIPDGVTTIDWNVFSRCKGLSEIIIPEGVTIIEDYAFDGCTALRSVYMPNSVTSIGNNAFDGCTGLTGVYITDIGAWCNIGFENLKANPLNYAGKIYLDGNLVTNLVIPDGVENIGNWMFYNCTGIENITIPDSVKRIGRDAFYKTGYYNNAANWENDALYIDNHLIKVRNTFEGEYIIKEGTLTIADNAFRDCTGLVSVTIPEGITAIGNNTFTGCTVLDSVTIPDGVTTIGDGAFSLCKGLVNMKMPDSITSIGDNAFYGCDKLKAINYAGTREQWNGISIGSGNGNTNFLAIWEGDSCGEGLEWKLEDGVLTITGSGDMLNWSSLRCAPWYSAREVITQVNIADTVTSIGDWAFYSFSELASIDMPDNVTTIGKQAFYYCRNLNNITIPESVTSVGIYAFDGCTGLKGVYITDIGAWCNIAFDGDSANPLRIAKKLYLNNELVTDLVIPEGITNIGESAFNGCASLKSVTIPDSVTRIDHNAFKDCTELVAVYINDLEAWCNIHFVSYSANPLRNAGTLYINDELVTDIIIPDGITSIGPWKFEGLTELRSITIPDSLTSINRDAFRNCISLENIFYAGSEEQWNDITIGSGNDLLSEVEIIYNYGDDTALLPYLTYEISDDKVEITGCDTSATGYLIIPDTIEGYPVTSIGAEAFSGCTGLTGVTIPGSVTRIGSRAFYDCTGLKGVHIPELKPWCYTEFEDIHANPLYYAKNLYIDGKSVIFLVITDDITSIGNWAFYNCAELQSLVIPNSVTSIGESAFDECWLMDAYYLGTESEWNEIDISPNNGKIFNTNVTYDSINVNVFNSNGKFITSYYTAIGDVFNFDMLPKITGYTLKAYYDSDMLSEITKTTVLTDNTEVYTKYAINQYTYKFLGEDGSVIKEATADYGTVIQPPEPPHKEGDVQYSYVFAGWNGYSAGMTVKENAEFKVKYNKVINKYTYKFLDEDGSVVKKDTIDYRAIIYAPQAHRKEGNAQYSYELVGWEGFTTGMTIESDIEFTVIYNKTVNRYTYRFLNNDESVIKEATVDYGTVIEAPSEEPKRAGAQQSAYTFAGWEGYSEGMTIEGNIDFTAKYTKNSSGGGGGGGGGGATIKPPVKEEPKEEQTEPVTPAEPEKEDKPATSVKFSDVKDNDWYFEYVTELAEKGIVSGNGNGGFAPNDNVTREQFLKMIIEATDIEANESENTFADVADDWYKPYVLTAKNLGIVNGVSDNEFGIGSNITRQDMAVMITRTIEKLGITIEEKEVDAFEDNNKVTDYAKDAVEYMKSIGLIEGYNNEYRPHDNLTRAEAAKVISQLLKLL